MSDLNTQGETAASDEEKKKKKCDDGAFIGLSQGGVKPAPPQAQLASSLPPLTMNNDGLTGQVGAPDGASTLTSTSHASDATASNPNSEFVAGPMAMVPMPSMNDAAPNNPSNNLLSLRPPTTLAANAPTRPMPVGRRAPMMHMPVAAPADSRSGGSTGPILIGQPQHQQPQLRYFCNQKAQQLAQEADRLRKEIERLNAYELLREEGAELRRWLQDQKHAEEQEKQLKEQNATFFAQSIGEQNESFTDDYFPDQPPLRRRSSRSKENANTDIESRFNSRSHRYPRDKEFQPTNLRAGRSGHAGATHTKVLLRKIVHATLNHLDDETLNRDETELILILITIFKEALLGLLIGVILISLTLFIDHTFMFGFSTARNFRRATSHLMIDTETIMNLEENAGLKILEMEEYRSMVDELETHHSKIAFAKKVLKKNTQELIDLSEERPEVSAQHEKLQRTVEKWYPNAAPDKKDTFCPDCLFRERPTTTCLGNALSLMKEGIFGPFGALVTTMDNNACVKGTAQLATEKHQKNMEAQAEKLVETWKKKKNEDFCDECMLKSNSHKTCMQRAEELRHKFRYRLKKARAIVAIEWPKCRNTSQLEENMKLARFCAECLWGWNDSKQVTCMQRVDYLVSTYKNTDRMAKLTAMETPECSY